MPKLKKSASDKYRERIQALHKKVKAIKGFAAEPEKTVEHKVPKRLKRILGLK